VNQPVVNPEPTPTDPTTPAAPAPTITVTPPAGEQRFTAADLERVRQQEKDKLYARLTKADERTAAVEAELTRLQEEAAGREAAAEAERTSEAQAAQEREKAQREAEMTARELLEARSKEWEGRFANLERERETERATLAKEAEFARLSAYVQERLAQEREAKAIAPELADLVTGNTREEIDASIEMLKAKTEAIFQSVQQAQVAQRSQMRGTAPTGFTAQGPLDNESGSRQLTPDQIKNMPMGEYRKYRSQLLGAASEAGSRGLFD
jgi:DNA polymerase III alpha subunit (gram-positive type)